jgi:hypothetical protein
MRVLIGDRFGKVLTEVVAGVGPVSWILNGIGKTTLSLALRDAKATEENLRVGNRIYIEMDAGLPVWGGVLDLPRTWRGGTVKATAYTIDYLLQYRCTGKNDSFYERPAGAIFRELLRREEQQDPLGITFGSIWTGGHPHWPRYHYKSLWYVLDYSLQRLEQCDWRFVPYLDDNHIRFRAEFYQVAGTDRSAKLALIEGRNTAEGLELQEQGEVINTHYAVGEGSTWGTERLVVAARDTESVARYGLRESGTVYSGVSVQSTLEMHARDVVNTYSEPRKIFSFEVTNNTPARFAEYDLGDVLACKLPSFGFGGFDGTVRVLARECNPQTGVCKLVVEEPHAVEPWIYSDELEETE